MTDIETKPPEKPASPENATGPKDIWDKIGTLTTLISSVVIGAAGVVATNIYNNRERDFKHQEKTQEAQIDHTKRLEALYKFVSSEKPGERAFGYAMFKALGEEPLAATLIAARNDKAALAITQSIVRDALTRYKPYLENIGFSDLQNNLRLIAFAQNDLEGTVPSEFQKQVALATKEGFVSFYYDGVIFIQNDWVDRPFVPLREYTHYALYHMLKTEPEQTSIESGLADYYPASYLDLVDMTSNGPAKVDVSFLEDVSAGSSASTPSGQGSSRCPRLINM